MITYYLFNLCFKNFPLYTTADNCGDYCVDIGVDYLAWNSPGVGRAVSFLSIQGLIYFTVVFFIESGLSRRLKNHVMSGSSSGRVGDEEGHLELSDSYSDSDVQEEKHRVMDLNVQVRINTK